MTVRRVTAVFTLCLLLLAGMQSASAQGASQIFTLVNQFRANNGLPAFQYNATLAAAAQNQANFMAVNAVFSSHVGEGGSTPQTRANAAGYIGYVVENIVGGTGLTPSRGLIWWQNSPVHYNTLVTSRYTQAGTGFATNGSENFYVLVVGRPSDAPPPQNTPNNSPEALFITPIVMSTPNEDGSIVHVVQEGQALWSLSAHYEVPLTDLLLYNGLKENSFLQPGDEVIIQLADGAEPPPTPAPPLTHVVEEGQSLWSVAVRYDLRLADLLWYNNLTEESLLQPGETLVIRLAEGQAPPPTPTPIVMHTVREGQTLWEVALTYGLTLEQLLAFNGLSADAIIQPGDQLQVRQPEPTATATLPPPTFTPLPPFTPTPAAIAAATAVSEPTPANMSLEALGTAVATPVPTTDEAPSGGINIFIAAAIFIVGLLALTAAGILYLRQQA